VGKWLAAGGAALVILLLVLWKQLDTSSATAAAPPPPKAPAPAPAYDPLAQAKATVATEHAKAGIVEPAPPVDDGKPKKIDVQSDEFFFKFQEVVPAVLSRKAALCYEGIAKHVTRNQKLTLQFHIKIKDGEVTINDVHPSADTLDNAGLSTCFTQAVQRAGWHDDTLPDWEADDELVLRPERGMKKYMRDNIDYVGAPAPKYD
jgi:hypothetical protein